jgi:4-diphosphocytidyl-2-C-methyl-D-erythritol kinase
VHVPTPLVFAAPELTRNTETLKMADFSATSGGVLSSGAPSKFRNDLQAVVASRFPEVRAHLAWLAQRGEARLTGSGGCVFAGFDRREAAQQVLDQLPASMKGFVAQGLDHHPLRQVAKE